MGCRYDPTGQFVAAGAKTITSCCGGLDRTKRRSYSSHDSWIRGLAFTRDGNQLLSAGYDGRLVWWEPFGSGEPIRRLDAHNGWIRAIEVSPDGQSVATCGNDNLVKLFHLDTGEQIAEFAGHEQHVYSVMFHPQGESLISGDLAGKIHEWNVASHSLLRTLDGSKLTTFNGGQRVFYGGVRCLALSPDGTQLAAGGLHEASNPLGSVQEPLVVVFDWKSGEAKQQLATKDRLIVRRVIYHPDGFLIAVAGCHSGAVLFFRGEELEPFHQHKLADTAFDGDLHPDGLQLATAHEDGKVRITQLAAKA